MSPAGRSAPGLADCPDATATTLHCRGQQSSRLSSEASTRALFGPDASELTTRSTPRVRSPALAPRRPVFLRRLGGWGASLRCGHQRWLADRLRSARRRMSECSGGVSETALVQTRGPPTWRRQRTALNTGTSDVTVWTVFASRSASQRRSISPRNVGCHERLPSGCTCRRDSRLESTRFSRQPAQRDLSLWAVVVPSSSRYM
jgi:hypothetical protein